MGYILNIETATKNCSVSLAKSGVPAALEEFAGEGYLHAEKLHVFIAKVLEKENITFNQLSAVAVSMGPGSYTGLRIGVSAAKGLCYALTIPLIAVDTLEILARSLIVHEGVIIPLIDARRMEVYSAVFDASYNRLRETRAEIITEESFSPYAQPVHLIGDGAAKCKPLLADSRFKYHDGLLYPSAAMMAGLSWQKFTQQEFEDVAYFEPYYLKDFIAGK
ncbi:tRNA (adenosine(37)-N6)-threonylcarbamoyltransferase complex dimerization subunit type 1 TsaB [Flavobacterium cyanobacteriorum]|uniref:tRNA (Adenosine(37)-N6)-threonylcarbamoyltransferase complex dimerization subunit type 1 TsaB n=1 Tax=Flavobacterium cyanobacteriorum TaxID=2022802 RepID=A0A255Z9T0_9FLAO|nr:tRNA (adenosine(37)-N6)-threonylcarbamoyltransferase complex dimerization subunit type 1 TsaB [Flavobacterium cyanobacteriorum]OYQ38171.1 tRNA (adenosine(37)-N6)-threonylcarbamoyltransferase complex dimerization subunit type 1 TsaB [Flavobacterium cyanobacteriorum]